MADPSSDLTQRVRDAVAGSYELLGPLGADEAGLPLYLAREIGSGALVGMTARRERPEDDEYTVEVRRTLGESVSVGSSTCPECKAALTQLDRFCPSCNTDLSGASDAEGSPEAAQLLNALALATVGRYEILGRMLSEGHGGTVYFARDIASQAIVALRMRRAEKSDGVTAEYVVRQTQAFRTPVHPYATRPASKFGSIIGSAKAAMSGNFSPVGAQGSSGAKSASAGTSGASPAIPAAAGTSGAGSAIRSGAHGALGSGSMDAVGDSAAGAHAPRKSRVPMIAAALVILAGVGYFATRGRGGADVAAAPAVTDTNAAVAVAPPPAGAPADSGTAALAAAPAPVESTPAGTLGTVVDSGTVRIGTLPADARVTVDGRTVRGRTLRVPAGPHTIAVQANGFEPFTQRVVVGAGRDVRFAPSLVATNVASGGTPTQSGGANTCRVAVRQEQWANALDLCAAEANAGDAAAATALARMFSRGLGTARNGTMAMNWYTKGAEGGDLEAQTALAYAMRDGRDTRRDAGGAVRWFKTAAERGDAAAQLEYAVALEKGDGTAKDERVARDWYRKSADGGNSMAARRLGKMMERGAGGARSDADAAAAYERAASLGDNESALTIAKWYRDGRGVAKSPDKALQWFKKAAELGNAEAAAEVRRLEKGD